MPDTTEDDKKLKGAFGDKGTQTNAISYGHPYADDIITQAKKVITPSETGEILVRVHDVHKIPIHVIKGTGPSGFDPAAKVVYLQVPGSIKQAEPKVILELVRALREADQEILGYTAPDPTKDIMEYATVMHGKNLDAIIHICKVVKELTNSSDYSDLLDALTHMGYGKFYTAYINDASEEELYDHYAET